MKDLLTLLEGKKTYVISTIAFLYVFGSSLKWWPLDPMILTILGFGGLVTARMGAKRDVEKHEEETGSKLP